MALTRTETVLAALAAAGQYSSFSPAQIQKLFFLIDREASHLVSGPHFDFRPYDYGPFDKAVYSVMDQLSVEGFVAVNPGPWYRTYSLTDQGYAAGSALLGRVDSQVRDYLGSVATWVAGLSFQKLVSAIYARYPDMRANSIFRE